MLTLNIMWTWIFRAWSWFIRESSTSRNRDSSTSRNRESSTSRKYQNFYYVTTHSSIEKNFKTFVVPSDTKIIFKTHIGNFAYSNNAPTSKNGNDWGVEIVDENNICINHKLTLPKDDILTDQVSDKVLRRPPIYKHSRILIHGVFKLPLPKWFDEFPSSTKSKLIHKMHNLNHEKRRTTSLKSVVNKHGPGVYFVSCCRVIRLNDTCYRVTSDFIETNNNRRICYKRKRKHKSKRIREIENLYNAAVRSTR